MTNVDGLPPTQYLMLEVLAARWRCGELVWTFPSRLRPIAQNLQDHGLVRFKEGISEFTICVGLTKRGAREVLSSDYVPPILNQLGTIRTIKEQDND